MRASAFFLLAFLAAMVPSRSTAQDVGHTYMLRYNLPDIQTGLAIASTADGGFIATGQHFLNGSYGECDAFVYRVDECGNQLWFNLYGTEASEGGKSILPLADGSSLVTGAYAELMEEGGYGGRGMAMRIGPEGDLDWFKLYPEINWIFAAREVPGGFVFVGNDGDSPIIMGVSVSGEIQWATKMTGMAKMALALEIMPEGDIVFATNDVLTSYDIEMARLSPNGLPLWVKGYGPGYAPGSDQHIQWGCDLVLDGAGHIYAIAPTQNTTIGGKDILLLKLDAANGDIVWSRGVGSSADDTGRQLAMAGDGIALVGSSYGFDALVADDPDALTEDLLEENILMAHITPEGYVSWAKIYGGADRERGVGVQFDAVLGYTVSAFTASPVFGNADNSMDALFMRTDLEGGLGCQSSAVTLVSYPVPYPVTEMNLPDPVDLSVSGLDEPVVVSPFDPNSVFQCEACWNEPQCASALPAVCLGDSIRFFNETQLGLKCQQEWVLSGPDIAEPMVFEADEEQVLSWLPASPGNYTAVLRSTCQDAPAADTTVVFVSDIEPLPPLSADYHGFSVSCHGGADGWVEGQAQGGFVPDGAYEWLWSTLDGQPVSGDTLSAGYLLGIVTDAAGCVDSIEAELTEPDVLSVVTEVVSDYGGYMVSCADGADGAVQVLPEGGVPGYGYEGAWGDWLVDTLLTAEAGELVVVVEDANGCPAADTLLLTAPPAPAIDLYSTLDSCGEGLGSITAVLSGDVLPLHVLWPESVGETVVLAVDSIRWEGASGGQYAVGVEDGNGCVTMDTVMVSLSAADSVSFVWSPPKVCYPGAEVFFEDVTGGSVLSRTWRFGDGHSRTVFSGTPESATTQYEFRSPGIFEVTLEVTNAVGCTSLGVELVNILEGVQVFVPSAFTPDNDGINDGFGPVLSGVSEFRWVVFDRWGLPVFESSDPNWWWNGSPENQGRSHMNELFTWRLEAQGQCNAIRVFQGQVQLIR